MPSLAVMIGLSSRRRRSPVEWRHCPAQLQELLLANNLDLIPLFRRREPSCHLQLLAEWLQGHCLCFVGAGAGGPDFKGPAHLWYSPCLQLCEIT